MNVSFITVRSDFHGYPRELAGHYTPTDLIQGILYHRTYLRRLVAMASYLQLGQASDLQIILEESNIGNWNDGVAFKSLIRTKDPFGLRGNQKISTYSSYFESSVCL